MDANQVKTKAEKVREWLRKCWTTRGLLVIGAITMAAGIFALYITPEGNGIDRLMPMLILFGSALVMARMVMRTLLAMFVSLPRAIIRPCMPKSWANHIWQVSMDRRWKLPCVTLFIVVEVMLIVKHSLLAYTAALILFVWFGYAVWLQIQAPWNRRLEIILFGQEYRYNDIWGIIFILIIIFASPPSVTQRLFGPFIVKAQYAAEGVPCVGQIRTLAAIHHDKYGVLPGVQSWEIDGIAKYADTSQSGVVRTTPNPGDYADLVQTFLGTNKAYCAAGDASAPIMITNSTILAAHYANQLLLQSTDLTGSRARPGHFQYMVMDSGFRRFSYAYAVGTFGDGDGFKAGTGYAVVEIVNPGNSVHPKIVAVWNRFKATSSQGPICLAVQNTAELQAIGGKDRVDRVLPVAAELIYPNEPTEEQAKEALAAMRQIGWQL